MSANASVAWFANAAFDRLAADAARRAVAQRQAEAPFAYVVTPNVDHLVRLDREPGLAALYADAWLSVCDSRVLELLAAWSGDAAPAVPGADLVEALFEDDVDPTEPVVIVGGSQEVVARVTARYGLHDVRWHAPPMGLRDNPQAIAQAAAFVAENPARFTFLCVGSPQQELLAKAIHDRGDARGVGICCGASLDFLAGVTARAPVWMRRARLEWLHRLVSQPRRLAKRYVVDGPQVFALWLRWRRTQARLAALALALRERPRAAPTRDLIS